jgi:hypothetical protein
MKQELQYPYDFVGSWLETPHGNLLVERDFFCVRCARIERFSLAKEEIASATVPHDLESYPLERKAIGAGWVITTAITAKQPLEYLLCPDCVAADLAAFDRFMALVDAGRHKGINPV